MTIQLNTDHNIVGSEKLEERITTILSEKLERFSSQITRLEVHLTDNNGHKTGPADKQCALEARLEGLKPIAVTGIGDNVEQSVRIAIDKLKASLDTVLGRLHKH
ncbi:MAG: HPF/RaiA family ribosome-associated protein [Bacteroidetes bacterium]|nr:HPF/RaiA family ribosome-associated protein [Bacteroidota bacterium]